MHTLPFPFGLPSPIVLFCVCGQIFLAAGRVRCLFFFFVRSLAQDPPLDRKLLAQVVRQCIEEKTQLCPDSPCLADSFDKLSEGCQQEVNALVAASEAFLLSNRDAAGRSPAGDLRILLNAVESEPMFQRAAQRGRGGERRGRPDRGERRGRPDRAERERRKERRGRREKKDL